MAERGDGGWDLIVSPWHLDEHIPAFPIPADVTETIRPPPSAQPGARADDAAAQAVADTVPGQPGGCCPATAPPPWEQ